MKKSSEGQPILIVDDSYDDFEATERALRQDGRLRNSIYHCDSGKSAIDFLFKRGEYADQRSRLLPGLILLDLNMPGMGGMEVLKVVKADDTLKEIPVVVLTTSNDERDVEQSYHLGANTFIQKPVDLDRFFEAIKRLRDYWFEIALLPRVKA